jgi:LCP family protein required for cell wall assembly
MILLTLDPLEKTAGILSIPRDMWVAIPGFQHGKINTAYYLGDAYKLPGGGPGLAVKTVEQFLGVPINFYAQIDFEAFIRFIDEIGGVKVDVPKKIIIDPLGDNNTKTLRPGVQTLPGDLALAYARQRHTEGGDFDRAQRQQQVILGIRNRVLAVNTLPTLITKAPTLYQELASGIHTNLSLDDAIKLARLASEIPDDKIRQGVLDSRYVIFGRSPDNLSILVPIPDKISLLRDEIFASSGALSPLTEGSSQEKMKAEGARVALHNGTSSPELASLTGEYLKSQGLNVIVAGDAAEQSTVTTIVVFTGKPYTMKYLVDLMDISPFRIISNYDINSDVDVEVTLGSDWDRKNPLQQ